MSELDSMVLKCEKTGKLFFSEAEAKLHSEETGLQAFAQVSPEEKVWICTETGKVCFNEQQMAMHKRFVTEAQTFEESNVGELRKRQTATAASASGPVELESEEEMLLRNAGLSGKARKAAEAGSSGPPVVTKELVEQLLEMGFTELRAHKALVHTSNTGVEPAINWLGEHMDDADIDDVVVIRRDGTMLVTKVGDKKFVGTDIVHVSVFKKGDERTIYNVIYRDGARGASFAKRFPIGGVTRDKEYPVTQGTKGSEVLYLSVNPNGEAEVVTVHLRAMPSLKKLRFDFDFSDLAVRGRAARGNTVTKNTIKRVELKSEGVSTLAAREIWFDETVLKLNDQGRGRSLAGSEVKTSCSRSTPRATTAS